MMNSENMQTEGLHMQPTDTPEQIENPQSNEEVFNGSFASILMNNIGYYVVVDFLIGTNSIVTREGILYASGINFLTLYDPSEETYTVCDLYSVKFVTFYNSTTRPRSRMTTVANNVRSNNGMANTNGMANANGMMNDNGTGRTPQSGGYTRRVY